MIATLQKHMTNNGVTILCAILIIWIVLKNRDIGYNTQAQVVTNRAMIEANTALQTKLILDFMGRTVDRWDKLQTDNPNVRVPRVDEPNVKPWLSDADMERNR